MSDRITDKDLYAVIDRLNEIVGLDSNDDKKYHLVHQYGMCYLMKNHGSVDISSGNTKKELYWQIITTNKILSNFKNNE